MNSRQHAATRDRIKQAKALVEASNMRPHIKKVSLEILSHGPSARQVTHIMNLAKKAK